MTCPYRAQLQHLLALATSPTSPAWRAQISHRLDELEADQSGLWAGIRADLNAAIKKHKEQQQ